MDVIALAMAKTYSDKQRLAYTARAIDIVASESKILLEPNDDFGGIACAFERYTITKFDEKYNPIAIVIWNGVEYWCKPFIGVETITIGNSHLGNPDDEDTGEPFFLMQTPELNDGHVTWFSNTTGLVTVRINYEHDIINPIDPKFIPAFDSITLNGADGKQYKLSVDESGTLVHTAVEGA